MKSRLFALVVLLLLQCSNVMGSQSDGRCEGKRAEPLLWRMTRQDRTAYILATYTVTQEKMVPMPTQVEKVLSCADIAYFELACSNSEMGNYMVHCYKYSAVEDRDSVPTRLPKEDYEGLLAAVANLTSNAPEECQGVAQEVLAAAKALPTSRRTLLAFYYRALRALHPSACERKEGVLMYEDSLRDSFGATKPIFGLRDVSTQCAVTQGNMEEEDLQLARSMIAKFSSDAWRANLTRNQRAMEDIMHCGNLSRLRTMHGVGDLPGLGERKLGYRNPMLARSIQRAWDSQGGKTLLFVVGVTRMLDFGSVKSVSTLLREAGFAIDRIRSGTDMSCLPSTHAGSGANTMGKCLEPPWRSQPASCTDFGSKFREAVRSEAAKYPRANRSQGVDTMGRTMKRHKCIGCASVDDPCDCDIEWENTSDFERLCNSTTVEGARGMVIFLDLTRNPGSKHSGQQHAEKTVRGVYQHCIATTCHIGFREEMSVRNWHQREPELSSATVTVRFPGQSSSDLAPNGVRSWPLWAWVLLVALLCLCISALVKVFLTKRRSKGGKRNIKPVADLQMQSELDRQFQEDRPPSPNRSRDESQQQWQHQQQQHQQQQQQQQQQVHQVQQQQLQPQQVWQMQQQQQQRQVSEAMTGPPQEVWPSPRLGTRPWEGADPQVQSPVWQPRFPPRLDWEPRYDQLQPPQQQPPSQQPSPQLQIQLQGFDNTIINQAIQMQQVLGDAGAQAVHQMQQQALSNWRNAGVSPSLPPPAVQQQPPPFSMSFGGAPGPAVLPGGTSFSGTPTGGCPTQPSFPGATGQLMIARGPSMPGTPPGGNSPTQQLLVGTPGQYLAGPPSPYPTAGQTGAAPAMPFPYARMA